MTDTVLKKLYVLDTNVLIHDPSSIFRFDEHDLLIPMAVLEELDNHKKGNTDIARAARQAARFLNDIVSGPPILNGMKGYRITPNGLPGCLYLEPINLEKPKNIFPNPDKPDHQILLVVLGLKKKFPDREVVLVSKDINVRLKANSVDMRSEDYRNDQILDDADFLPKGYSDAPRQFTRSLVSSFQQDEKLCCQIRGAWVRKLKAGEYLRLPEGSLASLAVVRWVRKDVAELECLPKKISVWGLSPRNDEQAFALSALTDPSISFVSLVGQAGSGKTLLALAAGLEQVFEKKTYSEILFTRATIPMGEDIGFLPGSEDEKMAPWMGAMEDNLEFLIGNHDKDAWGRGASLDLMRSKIKIKSMNFMRGRSFVNRYLVIDEAQNLTPKQMKSLITRAGEGTKVVCLGNLSQIDTPYLTEGSSGLTHVVQRFQGNWGMANVMLEGVVRSWLAERAAELL